MLFISLLLALSLGTQSMDLSKKLSRPQKIGVGSLLLSVGCLITSAIKKYQLSKEYERENK